ncbi:Auxin transport protein BIG [Linum perenne]
MEEPLTKLHRCLFESNSSPTDFLHSLRSDTSIAIALQQFYLILKRGVSLVDADDGGDKRLGFQLWTDSQIHAVVSFGLAIVSTSRSLSVNQAEPVIIAVVQQLLEFSVCFLENSELGNDESSTQINTVQLLEFALVKGVDKVSDQSCSLNCMLELLPVVSGSYCDVQFDMHMKCNLQGFSCLKGEKQVDRLLMTLATESIQSEGQISGLNVSTHAMSNLIFACQHWVVIHVDCIKRLIPCCKQLIELADVHGEKWSSTDFSGRLSFSLRIVRLLRSLVTESPYIEYDDSLLQQIALLADTIPSIFRQSLEFVNKQGAVESDFESLAISLVEEFLHLVQLIFCNSSVPQNIKVCIAASVLDNLDSSVWTYDKSAAIVKPPLVYFPRTIFLILGVIQDVRRAKCQNLGLKELDRNLFGSSSEFPNSPSCHLHCKEVPLLKRLTAEESLRVIFSSSAKWLDNLVHLILFLQCEGTKFRPKIEKSQSSSLKASCVVELENAVCHEDEALFGNLFSEGGRSVGSAEVYDQPQVVNSCSNNYNMPMQAASELLGFLKDVVFSQEYRTLYEDGCKMIRENHIIGMLSLLNYQEFGVEDRPLDGFSSSPDERKTWHIHELCLELLGSLLNQRALSASLEECLVDQILIVENGAFAYSDRALMLLANTLFARAGPDGSRLRTRLYEGFVAFIIDRTNNVCSECPSFRELIGTLPSVFHMEILIMAFHLSSIEEKATQANLISSTLQAIGGPSASFSSIQLSCWGLLVSRLILLLRHMLFYPDNCPSSLLLDLRSKLRDGSLSGQLSVCASEELLSWASVAAKSILGGFVEDDPSISCLINQLIDIPSLPPSVCKDDLAITSLSLSSNNLGDIFSRIMGLWKGRKASVVEDLLVERYIFLLCSDISMKCPESNSQVSIWSEFGDMDMSDTSFLFHFSHVVLGCSLDDVIDNDLQAAIFSMLKHISAMNIPQDVEELGWDFFRSSIGLSLILSLVNVGITRHANKNKVSESSAFFIKYTTHDMQYVTVAEQLVSSLISGNQIPLLVELLSSLLKIYLTAHQKAFIATLDTSHYSAEEFSPLSLLKHPDFDKCVLDEILRKCGISYCHLETAFDILLKVDSFVDKAALGNQTKALWESALHGFPFDLRTSSAVLLSCVISIRDIMTILDSLLGLGSLNQNIILDSQVHREILNSVMFIKFDRIFGSLSGICESVVRNLDPEFELSDYSDMYLLTYMEGFLRRLNESEASDSSVLEWLMTRTVDVADSLEREPKKYVIFKSFFGAADSLENVKHLSWSNFGDFLVLLDSLDHCSSDSVNVKVLNFFVDILSRESSSELKQRIQTKFLEMDSVCLSKWLEKRLLGSVVEKSGGASCAKGSSGSLRESATSFILSLMSSSSEFPSQNLHHHMFESLLALLDNAFLLFDVHIAKSLFHVVIQLCKGEHSMNLLLKKTMMLMEKLAGDDCLLPALKFLFGFLETGLSDCGSCKNTLEKSSGNSLHGNIIGEGSTLLKPVGSRKNADAVVLSTNQERSCPAIECDATSADDDEDDGTSDGDIASVDKDEDDSNNERALASKVCTFTSSGSNFMEQHWYFCYTCDLTVSKGCCSVCAKVCHRGHRVVYSRSSRFFCDCGAGGVRGSNCQCLKPRKLTANDGAPVRTAGLYQSFLPFTDAADQLPETDSDLDDDVMTDTDSSVRWTVAREIQDKIPVLIEELDMESQVLQLCSSLLASVVAKRQSELSKNKSVIVGKDKVLSFGAELLQLKKAYKSGSLDLKIKVDYSNTKDLRSHLATGSLVKSLLSVSNRGRLGVGEGDKVAIFDVGQLIGQAAVAPITADKTNVKPLSRNVVRFEIVQLSFNSVTENYLAVAGYEDCQVLTLNPRGEVIDRLSIELALQGAYIRRIDWVPGSQVKLMVVTNRFIKIYDLSQDNISPLHYFTVADDVIVDATLLMASQGIMFLVVLSEQGRLLRLQLPMEGNIGATPLKEIIQIEDRIINAKGSSLYYSCTYKLLLVSYHDGTTLMGRLSADAMRLADISFVYEEEHDGKLRPASLHRWRELLVGSGLFGCFSNTKSNSALAVYVEAHALLAQNMRHATSTTSNLVGLAAYKPLSKDKIHCLVLHDDGSLQIYVHSPGGSDNDANVAAEQVKKLGSGILNSKVYAGLKPEFPLDFFEKTVLITADVKLGGDAIRNGDSEGAKQSLGSEDGFLEGASPAGFKISVSNPNPDIVMVGIRVQVGNTSANHIPSEIGIFQRVIKLDEGMRSWYDIPFTVAESLLADEDFVISVGSTFNGTALPRIDSLEVYGRAKDEFGWKEKMDAVLGMEARVLGSKSSIAGSGKRCTSVQSTSIQEQVIADALKFLSKLYPLCQRIEDSVKMESPELKCKILLETIFESEREPLLQAAACRVLQAIYPKKERYYQVKDTMRLHGVVKSTSALLSRLGVGGTTGGWIIEEFTAQMRAVSKIALHRRSNLSNFLEINGSEVVDGLMLVLWGILDLEQPDTQTMNNIVVCAVELIYCYAECLASRCGDAGKSSVAPAVAVLKKLLFYPNEAVQSSSSLAISSRLLQVPFPKQTMLSTDDSVDSSVSASGPGDTSGSVNTQVMVEEDTITSSVQYCCDGCSTVPILRRRWHCTVCPDFDLCEACYQVLDVDRLPPPHSRDHPMTAIPIELESLGGDGSEIHFSAEDVNDSNLLRATSDIVLQNSAPSIHVLEPNESGEFSVAMTDSVSISASKRAVNSLLLSELLEQLSGWMHTTSGVRTIPIMQLFYRLSSAVGGPFIDGSQPDTLDLEKLIMWFLDETNLNQPFPAKTRSSFGEVAILVFMFFTLMLRNWHQPGTDGSAKSTATAEKHDKNVQATSVALQSTLDSPDKNSFASQLLRACSSLRNQAFVNYLMDILQQLMQVFKSSSGNAEASISNNGSGCGSLLTVRRDLPAGNFSPFFSDSYAKAHYSDIFMDYHRLLLENAFRLVYTLVRPEKQEKGDKEKVYKASSGKDLKLDGYQDVLCSYINNPNTTFVRRYARRLFLHICGSKTQYYSIRDSWQFSSEVKKLYKHINESGSLQNPVPYERSVKIVKCLSTMAEVAAARPRNWQKYCLRQGDVLPFFMGAVFYFSEESVVQTLRLINLAFYCGKEIGHSQKVEGGDTGTSSNKSGSQIGDSKKKKKGEDGIDTSSEKSYLDMEAAVDIFNDKDGDVLRQFIDCFLLEWNLSSVRAEAKCVLYGAWHHGKHSFKEMMLLALLQKVRNLPVYGQNIIEFTELVTWLLGKTPDIGSKQSTELLDRCLTNEVIIGIFDILHSQNELIANHPNSRIYNTLSGLVEFDGYYLESEPCVACSSPEVPYSRMKLESLKLETKFTDNRIIVKCTGSYTIQSVTMNVHDARKSKSVKVLNLYYNNRPVADLSELKNNWSSWKRAKSCHLAFNQTELKVEFPIPITACNFMIELDSFYENLQALSLEPLQCPRCSRPVTDKHGICSNCHENAYQCRQCRNINYENLDSFLCNECGYSKYGRFEFNFMAKPSFTFDDMENDEDMKRGLTAIESESENAHRRYQQLLGFKKPLLKIVSSIGENEMDSQQKDSVQQMMVSLPGPSCKVNRKIALLGVLYGEKCKAAFDSVSKSVQTLQGLRRVLMSYLHQKHSDDLVPASRFVASRSPNSCYGCATTFITQCLEILQVLSKHSNSKKQLVSAGILSELFENNIHQGPKTAHVQARSVLCAFSEGDVSAVIELNSLIQKKVMYCLEHHRSMDIAVATREEMILLSEVCSLTDEFWESRLRIVFQLLFSSIKLGAKHPAIAEHIILPCLRIISQACTPPKPDKTDKEQDIAKSASASRLKEDNNFITSASKSVTELPEKKWSASNKTQDIQLLSYSEWEKGASYLDFVRRQYKASQAVKSHKLRPQRHEYLALKYMLRWKRRASKTVKGDLSIFELGSWVTELVLSACSQSIRSEMCMLISLLCAQSSSRQFRLLNLLVALLPATLAAGESATEYFELLFKMTDSEDARLFLTVRGCLSTICKLIAQEVGNVHPLEKSLHVDISQGFILHKLIELLGKFLEVPNIRSRFMRDNLLPDILEALIVIRGLVVQKTKLISDCNRLLKDLLDGLLLESSENKRQFIRACISGLQIHAKERKPRTCLFILEQLCNLICPSKQDSVYLLVLNKAHTQEEFIRGSMTKNPYSSAEIGPLMRDVKNKICQQLDLLGLLEDDYGMELLVAGNIISLDLSIAQVYEQVWKKSNSQSSNSMANNNLLSSSTAASARESPPMTVTYRLQGLDGEATEPMIKELEEDREESQDPEVEFAIAGAVRECGGLEILLGMIQRLREDLKSNHEQLVAVLNLLMHCCRIRENRHALLKLGALGLLLETARRAFSMDAMEPAEGILLIVESLTLEANESDNISITQSTLTVSSEETGTGGEAKKIVLMFLERLCHPLGLKKSNKQQRNTEMVARILPYLTYGEAAAMEALVEHFNPYLQDWKEFDVLQKQHEDNPEDNIGEKAAKQRFAVENFVRVSESLKTSSCGERLKDIIIEKGITDTAVRHLRESFAIAGQTGFKSTAEWSLGLKLPSVPLILSMLRGLSMGHFATQRCIDEGGVLPLLHALEGVSGENEIGARAENLLDTLSNKEGKGDGCLEEKVNELRRATRDEMRRRALRKRHELLQGLGMRQELSSDGGERIVVARPNLEGLEDVEEEADGLACMVCREGYSLRPSDLLGVYTFSKRVNLGAGTTGSARGECVYTTVSYFNIIHFQCHQEAKRADAALKNPKKEWEGATLRNNESLCNSLFPIRGPMVPLAQYTRYVDQFWDNLNALGRADGSRLRLLTYDIVLMLARFATGASFSAESRGGGRESNSRFLPFMIQMARYLFEQGSPSQRRNMAKSISSYIDSPPSESKSSVLVAQPAMGTEETVQFMMVNSLLSESYKSWLQHRRAFLQRGIYHAYMQHTHGRSSTEAGSSSSSRSPTTETDGRDELLSIIRPMLVYTGLIEQLQQFLKVKKGSSAQLSQREGSTGENEMEDWELVMKERLLKVREMVGFSKELVSWLEEMNSASDLQEAFDIIGVLPDVLSGGTVCCEDFVNAAIDTGKS